MSNTGAFCELYEEQVRYALRVIADGKEEAFLWDDWDLGTTTTFDLSTLARTKKRHLRGRNETAHEIGSKGN
jgi:hypothetical protein